MRDFSIYCKYCNTKAKIKHEYVYMCCFCDEETRIIYLDDIKNNSTIQHYIYIKQTQGDDHA